MRGYALREGLMLVLVRHMFEAELAPRQLAAAIRTYNKLQKKNIGVISYEEIDRRIPARVGHRTHW